MEGRTWVRPEVPRGPVLSQRKRWAALCSTKLRFAQRSRAPRGMTLIEILVSIALIALLSGTLVFGSGMFGGAEQRAAATLIVTGVRKGLARANTTGLPVRMVLDFEQNTVTLEESSSRLALRESRSAEKDATQALLAEARAESEQVVGGLNIHRPSFLPTRLLGEEEEASGRSLGKQVELRLVQTEHQEEPVTEGRAYIFFWPGGVTERAVVQLGTKNSDGLTVVMSPLTGRARIERGRVELPEGRFGEDFSEREEP